MNEGDGNGSTRKKKRNTYEKMAGSVMDDIREKGRRMTNVQKTYMEAYIVVHHPHKKVGVTRF